MRTVRRERILNLAGPRCSPPYRRHPSMLLSSLPLCSTRRGGPDAMPGARLYGLMVVRYRGSTVRVSSGPYTATCIRAPGTSVNAWHSAVSQGAMLPRRSPGVDRSDLRKLQMHMAGRSQRNVARLFNKNDKRTWIFEFQRY